MEKRTLGAFIAILRKAKGLTQKQLAEMLNVSDKAVSRWERDECAPDLSAIPVLADIFGLTADELLRGQRKQAEEPVTHYETQKSEKQLRYLLKKNASDFTIRTCISIMVALFGLVAAMIGNLGFLRAYIGFFASCFFFIPALLCQVIFLIKGLRCLDLEEMTEETEEIRKDMILKSELAFSVTVCLFSACLPLLLEVYDTYVGLSATAWIKSGLMFALTTAIICAILCFIITLRLGYRVSPRPSTPKNKLRLRCALILAAVLLATYFVHGVFSAIQYANLHELTSASKWETWKDLKEYLETPMNAEGQELKLVSVRNTGYVEIGTYIAPDGTTIDITERAMALVYEPDMKTPKYEYVRRNGSVVRFYYSNTPDKFPVYTLNQHQLIDAENHWKIINLCLCSIYVLEVTVALLIYRRKVKQLSHSN